MKKALSMLLSLVMLLSVLSGFSFTAQAAGGTINSITIQEVVLPRPGATPSTQWSKTGVSWYANDIQWYEVPDSGYDIPLSSDTKFVAGKQYKAMFVAWANSGYEFAATSSINATIDGFEATVSQYNGRDTKRVVLVTYTFTCEYKQITNVVLTSDALEKGTELTTDFFFPQGEGVNPYCVSTFTRNGEAIAIGEKVTYGDYGASVVLSPMENYAFADNVSVKMGDKAFTVAYRIGMGIIVKSADDLWHIDCDHIYGAFQYDATAHWQSCGNCGDKMYLDTHDFNETTVAGNTVYTCSDCGYEKTAKNKVDGYLYADVEGGVQIVAYDGAEVNLTIPSTLDGKTVVSIGDYAFVKYANKTAFKSIILPSTITSIGRGAFDGCSALTSVNIPAGVKRIEAETFMACEALGNVTIPYGVNFIGESAFQGCGISAVIIPCSVKTIKGSAFRSCTNLGSILIPDSVTELGNAFLSCSALKSVVFGSGITSIAQATFDGCKAIETLTLPVELTKINKYNFDLGCVKTVNYRGTEAQFGAMDISTNTDLTSATKNYNYAEKIDIGQHKHVVAQTVAPTCVAGGYTLNMCEGCGDAYQSDVKDATGVHTYNSGTITTEPTCKDTGVKTYLCNDCGVSKTQPAAALGHDFADATCTAPKTCKREGCGVTEGKATGHATTIVNKKAATYFAKGYSGDTVCKVCKVTITKGKTLAKKALKAPKVKVTKGKKQFKVKYTKVKGATGFQVQYKKGKKALKTSFDTKKTATKAVKKLKKGTYKVKVRAFVKSGKKKAYSKWTKTYTVKVK